MNLILFIVGIILIHKSSFSHDTQMILCVYLGSLIGIRIATR